jgi:hypothetical protein
VTRLAVHDHAQAVDGSQQWPGPRRDDASGHEGRRDVQRVGGIGLPSCGGEDPGVDHSADAEVALLAGLEHEDHRPTHPGPAFAEEAGRTDQHGHVEIVAAGMHARPVERVVDAGLLRERQRIHVGAQQDDGSRLGAVEDGRDAGAVRGGRDLEAEPVERLQDHRSGLGEMQPDLGCPVEAPAEVDELGAGCPGGVGDRGHPGKWGNVTQERCPGSW